MKKLLLLILLISELFLSTSILSADPSKDLVGQWAGNINCKNSIHYIQLNIVSVATDSNIIGTITINGKSEGNIDQTSFCTSSNGAILYIRLSTDKNFGFIADTFDSSSDPTEVEDCRNEISNINGCQIEKSSS